MSSFRLVAAPSMVTGMACFFCNVPSSQLRPGWRLYDDRFAGLCKTCAFAYEKGTFCSVFHGDAAGWAECDTCKTIFHTGCIMSSHLYTAMGRAWIRCSHCCFMNSIRRTKPAIMHPQNPTSSSEVILLFEKKLTASDSNSKNGRLVLPKEHGEVHFPEVGEGEGIPITLFDSQGYEWDVGYRCWTNSKMLVLEGLKDFKKLWKLQPGDIGKMTYISSAFHVAKTGELSRLQAV